MAARYSEEFIQRVQDASNLVELISQYTQLKPSGHQHMGRCPFPDHPEKTPSFAVSEPKQVYHCFGCKKSGNVFTFLQTYNGMSFPEAVEYLARRASISLPEQQSGSGEKSRKSDSKQLALKMNAHAASFYHQNFLKLPTTHPARTYAQKRGLDENLIATFRLGHAGSEWDGLSQYLQRLKAPFAVAENLGLIKARANGSGHYDLFRDRLIFPILSPLGDVVGFGGRTLTEAPPKYLNSHESNLFSKGRILYGLHETAKYIRSLDQAIVVEGYMDFLTLYGAGIRQVVATLGTALTLDHARLLKRYTSNVLVLFDGDQAGQSAAQRSLPILLEAGLLPRGLVLPDEKDPDEFIRANGAPVLNELIDHAEDLFSLCAREIMKDFDGSNIARVRILDQLSPVLRTMADRRLRDLYMKDLAERMNVDLRWLVQSLSQEKTPRIEMRSDALVESQRPAVAPAPKIQVARAPRPEICLLNLTLKDEDFLNLVLREGVHRKLRNPGIARIFARIEELYGQNPENFAKLSACLAGEVEPPDIVTRHLEPTFAATDRSEDQKLLQGCVKSVQDHFLKSQAKALALKLKEHPSGEQLEQIMNIQKHRQLLWKDPK